MYEIITVGYSSVGENIHVTQSTVLQTSYDIRSNITKVISTITAINRQLFSLERLQLFFPRYVVFLQYYSF